MRNTVSKQKTTDKTAITIDGAPCAFDGFDFEYSETTWGDAFQDHTRACSRAPVPVTVLKLFDRAAGAVYVLTLKAVRLEVLPREIITRHPGHVEARWTLPDGRDYGSSGGFVTRPLSLAERRELMPMATPAAPPPGPGAPRKPDDAELADKCWREWRTGGYTTFAEMKGRCTFLERVSLARIKLLIERERTRSNRAMKRTAVARQ